MEKLQVEVCDQERRRTNQPNGDGEEVIVANARSAGKVMMQLDWEVFNAELSHLSSEKAVATVDQEELDDNTIKEVIGQRPHELSVSNVAQSDRCGFHPQGVERILDSKS